jgi:hypothetical protein
MAEIKYTWASINCPNSSTQSTRLSHFKLGKVQVTADATIFIMHRSRLDIKRKQN